jgi:hypothetical protein
MSTLKPPKPTNGKFSTPTNSNSNSNRNFDRGNDSMDESAGEKDRSRNKAAASNDSDIERGESKSTKRRDKRRTDGDKEQSEPLLGKTDENNNSNSNNNSSFFLEHQPAAAKIPEVQRSGIIGALNARQRRLDREPASNMPEIHIVGEIKSCTNIINDSSEGAFFRWKVDHGPAFHHIGGEVVGQTQVAFPDSSHEDELIISHPIDVHLAELGIPVSILG